MSSILLSPKHNAQFAVVSRLLSCLVTEGIVLAYYIPISELGKTNGAMVVLSPAIPSHPDRTIRPDDVLAIVLLRHSPVLLDNIPTCYGRRVGLVDPLDMVPGGVYVPEAAESSSVCQFTL